MLAPPLRMLDWYGLMSVRLRGELEDRIMGKTAEVGVDPHSSAHT